MGCALARGHQLHPWPAPGPRRGPGAVPQQTRQEWPDLAGICLGGVSPGPAQRRVSPQWACLHTTGREPLPAAQLHLPACARTLPATPIPPRIAEAASGHEFFVSGRTEWAKQKPRGGEPTGERLTCSQNDPSRGISHTDEWGPDPHADPAGATGALLINSLHRVHILPQPGHCPKLNQGRTRVAWHTYESEEWGAAYISHQRGRRCGRRCSQRGRCSHGRCGMEVLSWVWTYVIKLLMKETRELHDRRSRTVGL